MVPTLQGEGSQKPCILPGPVEHHVAGPEDIPLPLLIPPSSPVAGYGVDTGPELPVPVDGYLIPTVPPLVPLEEESHDILLPDVLLPDMSLPDISLP